MRLTLLIVTTFAWLLSCNQADSTKEGSAKTVQSRNIDSTTVTSQRQVLIKELQRLAAIFASKDKERIATIFHFPLTDTTLGIYIDDSTYLEQLRSNNDQTTRAMFLRFFPQIYSSVQMDEVNHLFEHLKIDSLLQKNTLEQEVSVPTQPCFQFYGITVEGDLVTLATGSGVNESYQRSSLSGDEAAENSSEYCEHVLWWMFRFDGKKLHFVKQHGAG